MLPHSAAPCRPSVAQTPRVCIARLHSHSLKRCYQLTYRGWWKNLGSEGYPLSQDLHYYTWREASKKEAAFINMLLTEFGQKQFVAASDYFTLPPERRKKQRSKLLESDQQVNCGGGNASSTGTTSS